jgi:hypothetical protein
MDARALEAPATRRGRGKFGAEKPCDLGRLKRKWRATSVIKVNSANFKRFYRAAAVSALLLPACGPDRGVAVEEAAPGIVFEGIRFRSYRGAELSARGAADHASLRRDTGDLSADRVDVHFPAREGPRHRVEAARLDANHRTREARLREAVVTRGGGGE